MPPGYNDSDYKKLLQDDLNGNSALDTASTAKEGVLQRLEVVQWDSGCISWGPDFNRARHKAAMCHGLLQSDQQLYQVCTLQMGISKEDGPHGGASLAEAGLYCMLDFLSSSNSMPRQVKDWLCFIC